MSYRAPPAIKLAAQVRFDVGYQYFGDRYADAANSLKLPSYDVLDVNLRWPPLERLAVYVRREKVLNEAAPSRSFATGKSLGVPSQR